MVLEWAAAILAERMGDHNDTVNNLCHTHGMVNEFDFDSPATGCIRLQSTVRRRSGQASCRVLSHRLRVREQDLV